MPFVVPQQQQPERQKSTSMPSDHREQAPQPQYQQRPYRQPQQQSPWQQARQPQRQYRYQPAPQPQGQYRQPMQRDSYGQRGGGRQYQQPQQGRGGYQQPQYQPQQQRGYDSYGRQPQPQYRQPPAQGSDEYNRYDPRARAEMDAQRSYQQQYGNMNGYRSTYDQPQASGRGGYAQQQAQQYSNRPQQGNYVGEGVYADGTPMPSSGYNGQSLIQSNAGPDGGVYANFNQTPDVNGGVTPRAYLEEDDVYSKPMRVGRGGGGIY